MQIIEQFGFCHFKIVSIEIEAMVFHGIFLRLELYQNWILLNILILLHNISDLMSSIFTFSLCHKLQFQMNLPEKRHLNFFLCLFICIHQESFYFHSTGEVSL